MLDFLAVYLLLVFRVFEDGDGCLPILAFCQDNSLRHYIDILAYPWTTSGSVSHTLTSSWHLSG